jgi:uncharacterized membrane protein
MKKPIHYLIFKLLAGVFAIVAIAGVVLAIQGFGDFESNNFMIGGMMSAFGIFATVTCAMIGFKSEMAKMATQSAKYIQQQNKEDLSEIASTQAEIMKDAVETTAGAVKEGLADTKFCKHCGAKIDEDSRFCKECGKEQ